MKTQFYRLLDSGFGSKLEQVGDVRIIRPAPQATWILRLPDSEWKKADAEYDYDKGTWSFANPDLPREWTVKIGEISMIMKFAAGGQIGMFPEHIDNQDLFQAIANHQKEHERPFRLLNLFAYTGAATLQAASLGAEVVHVDSAKSSVNWAKANAVASGLSEKPIRWIVDDVRKFVQREKVRGSRYDGILLDPPSFGRGSNGEIWKIEADLLPFMKTLMSLMGESFSYMKLSTHTQGMLQDEVKGLLKGITAHSPIPGNVRCFDLANVEESGRGIFLDCGSCAVFMIK